MVTLYHWKNSYWRWYYFRLLASTCEGIAVHRKVGAAFTNTWRHITQDLRDFMYTAVLYLFISSYNFPFSTWLPKFPTHNTHVTFTYVTYSELTPMHLNLVSGRILPQHTRCSLISWYPVCDVNLHWPNIVHLACLWYIYKFITKKLQ
jgi:hypothetical protein